MTQIPTNQSANPNQFGAAMGEDCREQEEEWEREGLLDPAWEKQQRKVCLNLFVSKKNWYPPKY